MALPPRIDPSFIDDEIADEVTRFAPRSQRHTATEDLVKHFKNLNGEQPLDMMAQLIVNLTYKDMMKLSDELTKTNKAANGNGAKATEVAANLHAWAEARVAILDGPAQ